jgi:hypothetical protein
MIIADSRMSRETLNAAEHRNRRSMTEPVRLMPKSALRIPDEILALFGSPPVLKTEDSKAYCAQRDRVAEIVKPKNIIEWMWVNDVVYHSWDIARLRRFKALIVEEQRTSLAPNSPAIQPIRDDACPDNELDTERGAAVAFRYSIALYERIDKLLESAERRRNTVLREIQHYREGLAHLLEEASDEIIDAEYEETAAA